MLPAPAVRLAEQQQGVVARYQLCAMAEREGWPPTAVDSMFRSSQLANLDPVVRGTRRVAGGAVLPQQLAFAGALRARPDATVTGPLALHLLGITEFGRQPPFEILVRVGRSLSNVPFRHRVDADPDRPVTRYGGVRVAAPLDALIDAASFASDVGDRALRVAYDQLRWRGIVRASRLWARVDDLGSDTPGCRELCAVLGGATEALPESEGERRLAPILGQFAPPPEPQVWVTPGRRVDFWFRSVRYGYEYLGEVDHTATASRLADDARDAELRGEGVRLGYVTAADLRQPRALLATIAGTLTVRAHELGVTPPVARFDGADLDRDG